MWEQYDFSKVKPQYRCFVRKLIFDHEKLFATSDLDCGNIPEDLWERFKYQWNEMSSFYASEQLTKKDKLLLSLIHI